jgi:hypothetical protein
MGEYPFEKTVHGKTGLLDIVEQNSAGSAFECFPEKPPKGHARRSGGHRENQAAGQILQKIV